MTIRDVFFILLGGFVSSLWWASIVMNWPTGVSFFAFISSVMIIIFIALSAFDS